MQSELPFYVHYLEARTNGGRPAHRVLEDETDQLKDARRVEGRGAHRQLVQYATHGPEVRSVVIWTLFHQLWRHIKWCAFDGCQHHCVGAHRPGKSAGDDGMETGRENVNNTNQPWRPLPIIV